MGGGFGRATNPRQGFGSHPGGGSRGSGSFGSGRGGDRGRVTDAHGQYGGGFNRGNVTDWYGGSGQVSSGGGFGQDKSGQRADVSGNMYADNGSAGKGGTWQTPGVKNNNQGGFGGNNVGWQNQGAQPSYATNPWETNSPATGKPDPMGMGMGMAGLGTGIEGMTNEWYNQATSTYYTGVYGATAGVTESYATNNQPPAQVVNPTVDQYPSYPVSASGGGAAGYYNPSGVAAGGYAPADTGVYSNASGNSYEYDAAVSSDYASNMSMYPMTMAGNELYSTYYTGMEPYSTDGRI